MNMLDELQRKTDENREFNKELENIKNQTDLENTKSEIKNTLEGINSKFDYRGMDNWSRRESSGNYPVQFSLSVVFNTLRPHGLQHARLPCPSTTPGASSNSCPSSQWCHPTIASSVVPFSSCLQSFPASGPFPMSHFFTSGGQSIGVLASASVLPVNTQDWFPLGLTGLISLKAKGLRFSQGDPD